MTQFEPNVVALAPRSALWWNQAMTCREVTEFLGEYLSGELPAAQRAAFDAHLRTCPECVTYLHSYRETVQLGKSVFRHPDEPVSDDVPEELVQAILAARRRGS